MGSYGSTAGRRHDQGRDRGLAELLGPVLEHYGVELRGSSRWGERDALCPIHGERRPSLRVNLEKGLFFCNACEARGTAIDLIRLMEGCDRATAVARAEALARAAGVPVREGSGGRD